MLERTRVRIDKLAYQCVEDASILAEEKEQRILVEAMEAEVETDALLLRQAVQNLLDNAMKYTPAGSTICVRVGPHAQGWEISVTDNGPGIPPEHRTRLTNRFFRADNPRAGRGFGLGLAITKAYLRVLGGELTYEPALPQGSLFRLILPRT
jgi:signal transduction histidine kinase